MMLKVAILFVNYGPYHLARLQGFGDACQEKGWKVFGIELSRNSLWKTNVEDFPYPIISVLDDKLPEQVNLVQMLSKLNKVLFEVNPDVLAIAGYYKPTLLLALLWCIRQKKPAILLSATKEENAPRFLNLPRLQGQEQIKSWIIKGYQAALVGGKPHKRYLKKLGMVDESIFLGYNVVGNEVFSSKQIINLPTPINQPYFLAVNRLVHVKNLLFLLSSYAAYKQVVQSKAWHLVICGDGELRSKIEQEIIKLDLKECVHLPGALQQKELLPFYAHANCFVLASLQEQWGLVINEAMASGLPILVSNHCGCYEDLVIEGVNGFVFDPKNSQELTTLLLKMSSIDINLEAMGKASSEHIKNYSPSYFAQGLIQAVEYALKHH